MAEQERSEAWSGTPEDDLDDALPNPTVIVDDLNVVYRVIAQTSATTAAQGMRRMFKREGGGTVFKKVHAVRGVTFIAREGDAIALIGRNGSGKSTLLRAIAGLIPSESGHVYTASRPTLLGVSSALIRALPGEDNILLGCMAMGMTREEALDRRDWIAEFADIGEFIGMPMTAYSSGMAARLRFAIAASVGHEILMVDEALATGDAEFRIRSEQRIMELREDAGTVFLVSHSLGVVRQTCNRAIWLEKGRILMDGEANEVVDAYEAVYDPEVDKQARKARRARKQRARQEADAKIKELAAKTRVARAGGVVEGGSAAPTQPSQPAPTQPAQPQPAQPDAATPAPTPEQASPAPAPAAAEPAPAPAPAAAEPAPAPAAEPESRPSSG